MEEQLVSQPPRQGQRAPQRALQLTKIVLLIFILGISVVARREWTWPFVTWILYSSYSARFRPPEPTVSAVELRVLATNGETYVVKPEQILSLPYDSLAHDIVEQAFIEADSPVKVESQRYLVGAISELIDPNAEIETIQAWKLTYSVTPLEVPPVNVQSPTAEVMLDSVSVADLGSEK